MTHNNDNPQYLYHGSRFLQKELKPGFYHTGKLVMWDGTESNKFLYATTNEALAVELGFASSIEKQFKIDRFHVENNVIHIETPDKLTVKNLENVPVYVYTLEVFPEDGWIKNDNKQNGIDTEYKTPKVIEEITNIRTVNVRDWLKHYHVNIERIQPQLGEGSSKTAMESASPSWMTW